MIRTAINKAGKHLQKDPEYLLEIPEFVEITELHANDWQL
jgi:hypothetical protein